MHINKTIKNIINTFGIITLFILVLILIFDFINISNYIPFTREFDWLNLLGAIVGGLIGAIGTFLGIYITIENERENNKKAEIDEKKRNGYSYVTFSNTPITIKFHLDSNTGIHNSGDYYSILIGENVNVEYTNFFDFDLEFLNLNSNLVSGAIVNKITLLFNDENKNNLTLYKDYIDLFNYDNKYKKITIKGKDIFAFSSRALINDKALDKIINKLIPSKKMDIIADISFINPNGIITRGNFRANLLLKNSKKEGTDKNIGSNKITNLYNADNTYLTIDEIKYVENMDDIIYK